MMSWLPATGTSSTGAQLVLMPQARKLGSRQSSRQPCRRGRPLADRRRRAAPKAAAGGSSRQCGGRSRRTRPPSWSISTRMSAPTAVARGLRQPAHLIGVAHVAGEQDHAARPRLTQYRRFVGPKLRPGQRGDESRQHESSGGRHAVGPADGVAGSSRLTVPRVASREPRLAMRHALHSDWADQVAAALVGTDANAVTLRSRIPP